MAAAFAPAEGATSPQAWRHLQSERSAAAADETAPAAEGGSAAHTAGSDIPMDLVLKVLASAQCAEPARAGGMELESSSAAEAESGAAEPVGPSAAAAEPVGPSAVAAEPVG